MAADMWKRKVAQGFSKRITSNRTRPNQRDLPQGRSLTLCPRQLHRLLHVPAHVVLVHLSPSASEHFDNKIPDDGAIPRQYTDTVKYVYFYNGPWWATTQYPRSIVYPPFAHWDSWEHV